jgi:hypothetical protein
VRRDGEGAARGGGAVGTMKEKEEEVVALRRQRKWRRGYRREKARSRDSPIMPNHRLSR